MNDREKKPVLLLNGALNDSPPADAMLLTSTLEALYAAHLVDVVTVLVSRVIGQTPNTAEGDRRDARLVTPTGDLQDFARLLLLDVAWAATVEGWTPAMRTQRAMEAIEAAGF